MGLIVIAILVVLLAIAIYALSSKREGLENYTDYSNNTNSADDMRIMIYKNAGNIAALKDAIDGLADVEGRLTALEKEYDSLSTVLKETKATADETKANVDSAVTDYKTQGDQQSEELNSVSFE
jgi:predicted  nucleic acid-binding Zn-ribbon protein